jgi:hypothetical protein
MRKLFVTTTVVVVSILMIVASSCKEQNCYCKQYIDGIYEGGEGWHQILKGTEKCETVGTTWEEAGHLYKVECETR